MALTVPLTPESKFFRLCLVAAAGASALSRLMTDVRHSDRIELEMGSDDHQLIGHPPNGNRHVGARSTAVRRHLPIHNPRLIRSDGYRSAVRFTGISHRRRSARNVLANQIVSVFVQDVD